MLLAGLAGFEVLMLLLLLTVPLSWPQVAGGWGDVAMLQTVAGLSPPYCTPPGHPGGGGRGRDDLPNRTVRNPEPQPIARKAGGELDTLYQLGGITGYPLSAGGRGASLDTLYQLGGGHHWKLSISGGTHIP
jgi:hypothetical protein